MEQSAGDKFQNTQEGVNRSAQLKIDNMLVRKDEQTENLSQLLQLRQYQLRDHNLYQFAADHSSIFTRKLTSLTRRSYGSTIAAQMCHSKNYSRP